ncbi:MAG: hypothetical protein ABSD48_03260 [Armatimonadota bacterium]
MRRTRTVPFALVVAALAAGAHAGQTAKPSRPTKEKGLTQVATYDPSFWVFGDVESDRLKLMHDLGFMGVTYWAADREGEGIRYFFDSPSLRRYDWATQERPNLTQYAAQAHANGLKVMVNMEGVNPYHWKAGRVKWTPELIGEVMTDLHRDGADRWFTECVAGWPSLFFALADTGRRIGMEYQEGDDPSYVYYSDEETGQRGFVDVYRRGHLMSMYHYQYRRDELGKSASLAQEGSLAYAFARGWGMPTAMVYTVGHDWGELPEYWEGIFKPSVAIRALQFRVDDVMPIGVTDEKARRMDVAGLKRWVSGLVARNAQEHRPVLNLVAHLRRGDRAHWQDLAASGDAITSGAFHAGWDVVASTEPRSDADGYYIYTAGHDDAGTLDLTPEMAALFAGEKPVFLQVGFDLPSGTNLTPNWRAALAACGVDPDGAFTPGDMPTQGTYRGMPFRYTGVFTAYEVRERPRGTLIPRAGVTGTVTAEGEGVPLIVSRGSKHLIPANCIRWQMMGPISDLLAGCGVRASSDVWGIAGEKVTVLLATHDTDLDLVIPKLAKGATIAVTQWDKHHQITHHETVTYTGAYHRAMKQFDSILIEAE